MKSKYIIPQGAKLLPTAHGLRKPHIMYHKTEMKHCAHCDTWYPLSEYWQDVCNWDSLQCHCKACTQVLNDLQKVKETRSIR